MATMNISVPDPMRDWVHERVTSGSYASASDYVRDLIRRDQQDIAGPQWTVEEVRQSIEESRRAGTTVSADAAFDRLEEALKSRTR